MVDQSENKEGPGPSVETLSVSDLVEWKDKRGEDAFRRRYPHPFLVLRYSPPDDPEEVDLQTVETKLSDFDHEDKRKPIVKVVPLIKSNRNAFKSKITLGRAKNNDVIIRAAKVSKVHAAFLVGKDPWQLLDMGSVNGTVINGDRLEKNQSVDLKSGDMISFWRYVFEYQDLDSFIAILVKFAKVKDTLPPSPSTPGQDW
ncbi:FHA domain-containing protein [Myxococcota bacterium]